MFNSATPLLGRCILVVEDDYFLATDLADTLSAAGAKVLGPVPTLQAALDLMKREVPDATLIDVNLSIQSGFPVADALASNGVPFLFVSGYGHPPLPDRHSGVRLLSKPLEPSTAVREVRHLFSVAA